MLPHYLPNYVIDCTISIGISLCIVMLLALSVNGKIFSKLFCLLINTPLFTRYRRKYIEYIHYEIDNELECFCCRVRYSKFICWKDLKEIKSNIDSDYIRTLLRGHKSLLNCDRIWFDTTQDRLNFLEECLSKFKSYKV